MEIGFLRTCRSFHYQKTAATRKPLPWLAKPSDTATSPKQQGREADTRHTDKISEEGRANN